LYGTVMPSCRIKNCKYCGDSKQMPNTEVYLLSGKNDNFNTAFRGNRVRVKKILGYYFFVKNYCDVFPNF
jgi:hypothetical protein